MKIGRYRTVDVPLYRTGDVEALLERPDVDWEAVRACPKGEKSPLLEIVGRRQITRAQAIRSFLQWYGAGEEQPAPDHVQGGLLVGTAPGG